MEALKLAPDNRELRRLLLRVKEECIEASRLENAGAADSSASTTVQPEMSPAHTEISISAEVQRKKEETAL